MKKKEQQRQCFHEDVVGLYGDAIVQTNKRGICRQCGLWLDSLPPQLRSDRPIVIQLGGSDAVVH